MKVISLAFFLCISCSCFAAGDTNDGNYLLTTCTAALKMTDDGINTVSGGDQIKGTYCVGYISGIKDMLYAVVELSKSQGQTPTVCMPEDGIGNGQALRIVVKFLKDHPEQLHNSGITLVLKSLQQSYPCS